MPLGTPKLFGLVESWSDPKCLISSDLSIVNYDTGLSRGTGISTRDKFKFAPFSTMEFSLSEQRELSCRIS